MAMASSSSHGAPDSPLAPSQGAARLDADPYRIACLNLGATAEDYAKSALEKPGSTFDLDGFNEQIRHGILEVMDFAKKDIRGIRGPHSCHP